MPMASGLTRACRFACGLVVGKRLPAIASLLMATMIALTACGGGGDAPQQPLPGEGEMIPGLPGAAPPPTVVPWMDQIKTTIQDRKLTDIVLPGTHESATYGIDKTSAPAADGNPNPCTTDTVKKVMALVKSISQLAGAFPSCEQIQADWSKAQQRTTVQQLADGIRYLDLRVWKAPDGSFKVIHSLVSVDIDEVLDQVRGFYALQNYDSREVVILDINHTYGMTSDDDAQLIAKIRARLNTGADSNPATTGDSLLIPRCADTACTQATDLTLKKLWAIPKQRVIVFYTPGGATDALAPNRELWYNTGANKKIVSRWPNTNQTSTLAAALRDDAWENADVAAVRAAGGFTVLQAIRTFKESDIVSAVTSTMWNRYGIIKCVDPVTVTVLGYTIKISDGFCVGNYTIWDSNGWCRNCKTTLLDYGAQTNSQGEGDRWASDIFLPAANIVIIDNYQSVSWKVGQGSYGYVEAVKRMNQSRYCDIWREMEPPGGDWGDRSADSTTGANMAIGDIDGNGRPEIVVFQATPWTEDYYQRSQRGFYRIGWDANQLGYPARWSGRIAVGGFWWPRPANGLEDASRNANAMAVADLDGNGAGDLLYFLLRNGSGYLRIGWNPDKSTGVAARWDEINLDAWWGSVRGVGMAVADLDGNGRPDLLIFSSADSWTQNSYYVIEWNLSTSGRPAKTTYHTVNNGWLTDTTGGIALRDIDGNGRPELVVLQTQPPNAYYGLSDYSASYSIGWNLDAAGAVSTWSPWQPHAIADWWGGQFGGVALADVNGNGRPDLFVFGIVPGSSSMFFDVDPVGRYRYALDLTTAGAAPAATCSK